MNPFIIISANTGRDKEAHIVKFPPTSKMNFSYFGTGSDVSRPDEGLYYVNNENMPIRKCADQQEFPCTSRNDKHFGSVS